MRSRRERKRLARTFDMSVVLTILLFTMRYFWQQGTQEGALITGVLGTLGLIATGWFLWWSVRNSM